MPRFIVAVCFAGCFALPAVAAPLPKTPPLSLPRDIQEAWEGRGARLFWEGTNANGQMMCMELADSPEPPKEMIGPTLRVIFHDFHDTLKKLPALNLPFSLDFHKGEISSDQFNDIPDPENFLCLKFQRTRFDENIVKSLSRFPALATLEFWDTSNTDEALAGLNRLAALKVLNLECSQVTQKGFAYLKELNNLVELNVSCNDATDRDLQLLIGMTALQKLDLSNTKITDAGLIHLKRTTELHELNLFSTAVGDEGLKNLAHLKNLRTLNLQGTRMTDAGLGHLKNFAELRSLVLYKNFSDAGFVPLKALNNLKHLEFYECPITDLGAKTLTNLKQLDHVIFQNTRVTEKTEQLFAEKLPKCKIHILSSIPLGNPNAGN
jgi:hypothetical protein